MIDVGRKAVTNRRATARVVLTFPERLAKTLAASSTSAGAVVGPKGPVTTVAVVAGVSAAKLTAQLIPLCHPMPMDGCRFDTVRWAEDFSELLMECTVETSSKTGIEMEALTAASIAGLTAYDMLKGVEGAHDGEGMKMTVRLTEKRGGKKDFVAP